MRTVVSFDNAGGEATGILTKVVTQTGDEEDFKRQAQSAGFKYVAAQPGEAISV